MRKSSITVAVPIYSMISYRHLAHRIQQRLQLRRFEDVLESLSGVLKAVTYELSSEDGALLKKILPDELRQVISQTRPSQRENWSQCIELISQLLEIPLHEAQRRAQAVLQELKSAVSPWDDLGAVELLLKIERLISSMQPLDQAQPPEKETSEVA